MQNANSETLFSSSPDFSDDGSTPPGTDWQAAGFGVYVHWPFCLAKCPYCDFNSHVTRTVDHARWRRAFVRELEAARAMTGPRAVDTVFFGGGTPSLMEAETVGTVIETIDRLWGLRAAAEVTLEANPTSVEASRFADYASAGVNRVSMGVQALNDADLRRLGRRHDAAEARAAFDIARRAFDRVSFDLIYARQDQTPDAWRGELREALAMAVDHLSLYQLTIEAGTRFAELHARGGLRGLPADERSTEMYEITEEETARAGMYAYEVSNHARPGAESRHNLIYWRYGDYVGVGPGAHGRITTEGARQATETPRAPEAWLSAAEGAGAVLTEPLPEGAEADEYALMSLRLAEGMDTARYARLAGAPLDPTRITALAEEGFLTHHSGRIVATTAGRRVLNRLIAELLA